uniref:Uncharacterized protein n=1 Tax=Rhizophora mucronata TaxID=61149 RepID=A0A2P2LAE7_RHIMU
MKVMINDKPKGKIHTSIEQTHSSIEGKILINQEHGKCIPTWQFLAITSAKASETEGTRVGATNPTRILTILADGNILVIVIGHIKPLSQEISYFLQSIFKTRKQKRFLKMRHIGQSRHFDSVTPPNFRDITHPELVTSIEYTVRFILYGARIIDCRCCERGCCTIVSQAQVRISRDKSEEVLVESYALPDLRTDTIVQVTSGYGHRVRRLVHDNHPEILFDGGYNRKFLVLAVLEPEPFLATEPRPVIPPERIGKVDQMSTIVRLLAFCVVWMILTVICWEKD